MSIKINRLIDDYEDTELRDYWKINLEFILYKNDEQHIITSSSLMINPTYPLVIHPKDVINDQKKDYTLSDLHNTTEFMNLSSKDLYLFYNKELTSTLVTCYKRLGNNFLIKERLKLYPADQVADVKDKMKYKNDAWDLFKDLKFPEADLFRLCFYIDIFLNSEYNDKITEMATRRADHFRDLSKRLFQT